MSKLRLLLLTLTLHLTLSACSGPVLVPTPNLYWARGENPYVDVPEALQTTDVDLLYVTDRLPLERHSLEYGYRRSHSLAMGVATVRMGIKGSTWDDLVEASTVKNRKRDVPMKVVGIVEKVRLPASNTPQSLLEDGTRVESPEHLAALEEGGAAFQALIRDHLALTPKKEVYIYVHGYANEFDDAAIRMANLWHFLGREGVPVFYTWPAGHPGLLHGYNYDRESSEFTVFHLKQFARLLSAMPEVERIHIVGHSRGTDVVLNALREMWIEYRDQPRGSTKLANCIIAAADIDWEVLQQRLTAERLPSLLNNWVFYMSEEDKALGTSNWLFGGLARLGRLSIDELSPAQRANLAKSTDIQVVDVHVKAGFIQHAYFIDNPAVLSDLILVLREGQPAGAEYGRPLKRENDSEFWTLTDDYLVEP